MEVSSVLMYMSLWDKYGEGVFILGVARIIDSVFL
jgi:hypothetical protein